MGGRPRCERHDLLWFAAAILSLCATTPAAAAGTATARHQQPEASSMTVHVPIPMTTLAEPYASIHQTLTAHRNSHKDWVALGGGTGFLKYRVWPGEQSSTTTGVRLLSQSSFPFGVEYAKQINGTVTKIADCGQQDASTGTGRLSVTLATTLTQGRAYTLLPASSVTAVEANRPCRLSEQGVDTAPLMAQVYRSELQGILPTVDRKAGALVTLKPAVAQVWKDLQEPLLLDEAEGVWLQLNPEAIGPAGIETLSGTPTAGYGVTARPTVVRGTKPLSRPLALPDLQSQFHDDGFHVAFALQVPIEEANQRLREAVVGQEWSLGVGTIKIVGATLYPLGNQVGVELILRGLLPLTLRLKGTPAYDESTGRILFRDVDYTIKERTPATDLAEEWLHEPLRNELAGRLVFPVREELDLMRQALEKGLNRNLTGGRLRGTVSRLSLEALTVQTASLSVRFKTEGMLHYDAHADIAAP
ncbi:MAG: DUF4403 family protein [Nitrospira sp.]|nr:DUF4403 family protein [Nitrospira sp.]MBP6606460.1 DUF4403 family protein [Nitrospira sp.]HQY58860.1 DUF4403 family protein [Nitrospira sp.]HRA98431.1 DUF4403 family protein [Nitrospira sp.]